MIHKNIKDNKYIARFSMLNKLKFIFSFYTFCCRRFSLSYKFYIVDFFKVYFYMSISVHTVRNCSLILTEIHVSQTFRDTVFQKLVMQYFSQYITGELLYIQFSFIFMFYLHASVLPREFRPGLTLL